MSKQIMSIPTKIIKKTGAGIKAGAKAAMAPASPAGTWQFVLGAAVGAPISSVYSFLYNQTIGKIPMPVVLNLGIKLLAPLIPIAIVKSSKIPFGNIINGALVGIIVAQGINILFGLLAGKLPALGNSYQASELATEKNGFFSKIMGD